MTDESAGRPRIDAHGGFAIAPPAAECAPARARHMSYCRNENGRTGIGFAGGSKRRPGLRRRPRQ
jgi:hypothetical protein